MEKTPSSTDMRNSTVQILPNAQHAIQNFYGFESPNHECQNNMCSEEIIPDGVVVDMYYYSDSRPDPVEHEIIRKALLELIENRLDDYNILCLYGDDGVGVTTVLSQFVQKHATHCVSYFYDGLSIMWLNPEVMEQSIVEQLYWFVFGSNEHFNRNDARNHTLATLWTRVSRKIKNEKKPLYFAFDGFDDLPIEKKEGVKRLLANMDWSRGRFIFTGKKEKIKELLPTDNNLSISEHEITPFEQADIREYFRKAQNDLSDKELGFLCEITRGNGHRMEIVLHRYIAKNRLQDLLQSNFTGESDLYDEDFQSLFVESDSLTEDFFALLTYADFPLHKSIAAAILNISTEDLESIEMRHSDFVSVSAEGYGRLSQPGFHKYLKSKLKNFKQETELRILHELQKHEHEVAYTRVIPTLMKSLGQTENLVSYLSNENMQQILVTGQSQAALNEQCEFGFNACGTKIDRYASAIFRFAVNRSMSRETEKNELWDYELEALLAAGHIEQALALAQNVYLSEERLKSFLIIARRKKLLSSNDYDIVKDNIDQLVSIIEFEKIPDKAIELAKLLLPIDYKAAICIVDRVTKANKETINADRVYSMMSLLANNKTDEEMGNVTNFDVVSSKIENDELRAFTHAAKSLFADASVDQFLTELNKLPNNSRKLHLLQFWLPEHKEKEGIGKAILEAIQLIVAVSGTDMPKAKILNRVCQSMSKMTEDEMMKAMAYIESMSETIKYPTFDYVDAELTIIEATKDVLPQKSKEHLENIYLHILDLKDDSVKVACLSKLLGRFDYLGEKAETEKALGCSSVDIRKEITELINKLLQETAYHLKVVEEPIKALVCNYSTMIDELVAGINTDERKKRAYSLAATHYLLKQDEEKVSPTYFFELISKSDNTYDNIEYPLELLSEMLLYTNKVDHAAFLPVVKKNFHFFEELERAPQKVMIFMRLYLWIMKNFPTDTFAVKLRDSVLKNWDLIDTLKSRIECGFFLAKNFAKTSKEYAETILNKCNTLKAECLLGSTSCVSAYEVAMKLYVRSMSLLVRYGLSSDESVLSQFRDDVDSQLSRVEKASIWGNIALEYYLANNHQQFDELCMEYIPTDFDGLSVMSQKCIIYRVAPALFIHSRDTFYTLLSKYDETFKNDCLRCIAEFIIGKQAYLSGTSIELKAYDMDYKDYQDLIAILEHSTSDDTYYQLITIISRSLREGKPKYTLSLEQKKTIINRLEQVVCDNLPTAKGIQHDGYKIACLATMKYANGDFGSDQKTYWETEIERIANNADRAFLFLQIAPYFKKKQDKTEFFIKGIKLANSLSSTYDKVSRLDMSINECMENNLSDLVKPVAESALTSLRINGTLEDHQRLIDMVYQHRPELAEEMVSNMDRDPARVQYKQRLLNHISSAKKLKQAHENFGKDDFSRIHRLSLEEQIKFFEKRLDDIVNGTGQLLDVETIFNVCIKHIYANNIGNAQWAILYIMEDIFNKYKLSKENRELLLSIHSALRFNLKLALSLGAGTKERIYRVDSLIQNNTYSQNGYIKVGEEDKAMAYITNWYQSVRYNTLTIIDPYFKPKDLGVIKTLCDINNDLEIRILTHRGRFCNEDYSSQWHAISSGVTNTIKLNFVGYADKPEDGPMHDRYWICSDEDNDTHEAIMLCSVDTLGKKESSIIKADDTITLEALHSYMKYVHTQNKTIKGRKLQYESMNLD